MENIEKSGGWKKLVKCSCKKKRNRLLSENKKERKNGMNEQGLTQFK